MHQLMLGWLPPPGLLSSKRGPELARADNLQQSPLEPLQEHGCLWSAVRCCSLVHSVC